MTETLFFDIKPISLNKCTRSIHRGRVATIKSEEYRLFEKEMAGLLSFQREKLEAFAHRYNHGSNYMVFDYCFKFPHSKFFTKAGPINKRCADVDNLVKPINDQIFKWMGAANPEVDDACIVKMTACKVANEIDDYRIIVNMSLIDSLDNISMY